MRRLAPLAAVAGLAALAGPAMADIRFEGRTSQGRQALVVAEDDGVPKRGAINWRAHCRRAGRVVPGARGSAGRSTSRRAGAFATSALTVRVATPDGERLTVSARISGRKVGPRRWVGRFGARAVVRRRGRVRGPLRRARIRWRVVRVASR